MNKVVHAIEVVLFRARWLLAPLYIGLVGTLILLAYRFVIEFIHLAQHIGESDASTFTLDLLDSYGGTLIVVSHDRYFLERVCDRFVGLLGDGSLRDLPRGVDQYLEQRIDALSNNKSQSTNKGTSSAAEQRQLKKDVARLEKQLLKLDEAINALVEEQSSAAFDAERLIEITAKLEELRADKNTKEEEWLFATTALDN